MSSKKVVMNNVDRLSSLPEELISQILSLMPTRFAVRTSILSKRLRYTWMSITNLHFDGVHSFDTIDRFVIFVDEVLDRCKTTHVKSFRLDLFYVLFNLYPETLSLRWIQKAINLNVSELEICSDMLMLPCRFVCKTLTKLRLVCYGSYENNWNFESIDLPSLKTLDIKIYDNPTGSALKLIPGCPLLESLSLEILANDETREFYLNIPTLKHLKLRNGKGKVYNNIVLNVPNLEDLYIGGRLRALFVMENFPSMVAVSLACYEAPHHLWVELLNGISEAKSLSLYALPYNPSVSPMPKFPNLKYLNLTSRYSCIPGWLFIREILESSSELDYLCIEEKPQNPYWIESKDSCRTEPKDSRWIEPRPVPTWMLENLRTMKFRKFTGQEPYMQLLSYMLGNAEVLKTVTIIFNILPLEEEIWLRAEVMKLSRASKYCEIRFLGSQSCSTISLVL